MFYGYSPSDSLWPSLISWIFFRNSKRMLFFMVFFFPFSKQLLMSIYCVCMCETMSAFVLFHMSKIFCMCSCRMKMGGCVMEAITYLDIVNDAASLMTFMLYWHCIIYFLFTSQFVVCLLECQGPGWFYSLPQRYRCIDIFGFFYWIFVMLRFFQDAGMILISINKNITTGIMFCKERFLRSF